jgi:protein-tyrosine phosphatase
MHRRFFLFAPLLCLARPTGERHIKLEGAQNFRDIGGYPTVDGKRIRYGRVFRSDVLAKLTGADYQKLSDLKIRTVCDLRSAAEREREKTQWKATPPAEIVSLDVMAANPERAHEDPTRTFLARLLAKGGKPEDATALISESMRTMALTAAPLYGKLVRRILESGQPLLFHCTAGKDRTGLGTALLMKILGVKEEAIYEDYLLVNQLVPADRLAQSSVERMKQMTGQEIPIELVKPMMGTQREWLSAAFAAIDEKYGSFDNYRREAMGISDSQARQLRRRLLQ